MSMEITIQVPTSLWEQLQRVHDRLPEILERGLSAVTAEEAASSAPTDDIAALREYARNKEYRAFGELVEQIDWATRSPDDLTTALDLALSMEMSRLAVELAQLGGRLFPDHERVQRAARVLAPPTVRAVHPPRARGLSDSMTWIDKHSRQYHGQWVAVREGQLLGAAPSLDDVMSFVGQGDDAASTIVTRML